MTNHNSSKSKERRSRFKRDLKAQVIVQDRDLDILHALYDCQLLTTSQIAVLFFSAKKRADQRLRKLWDAKLVDRIFRPVVFGSKEVVYVLGKEGVKHLANGAGIDPADVNAVRLRAKQRKPENLDHFIGINQLRIALDVGAPQHDCQVLTWKYENELKSKTKEGRLVTEKVRDPDNPRRPLTVNPDGFIELQTPKGKTCFFHEHELEASNQQFKRKVKAYTAYYLSQAFQRRWKYKIFRVLTTARANRLPALIKTAGAATKGKTLPPMFYFADAEDVTPERIFTPIWHVPNQKNPQSLY
jgi:hypothetical protein